MGSTSNIPQVLGNSVRGNDSSNIGRSFQSPNSENGRGRFSGGSNSNNSGQNAVTGPTSSRFGQGSSTNVDRSRLNSFLNGRSGNGGNQRAGNALQTGNNQSASGQNQNGQGSRHYAGRLTDDQVRNFLNMRGNSNARVADNNQSNNGGNNRSGRNWQDRLGNQIDGKPDGNNLVGKPGDRSGSGGDNDRFKNGDNIGRGNGPRFGNGDNNDKDGKNNIANIGDGRDNFFKDRDRDGRFAPDARGNFDGRGDRNFSNGRGRDFRGNDSARHSFNRWNDTWKGRNGDGRDHRDWSGKWRDGDRFDIANNIRGNWWNRRDYNNFPFRGGWWGGYSNWGRYNNWGWGGNYGSRYWDDYCVRYNRPWYWWGWTSAPVLTNWCNFGWSTPYYWDYGPNEYIYANNGVVYVNGAWYQPAPVFYQQTVQLIDQVPIPAADAAAQVEWLPLGVFAVTPDGMNEPDVMAQLAVTKDGAIGGTVMDEKAGKSYTVTGTVDKNSQRAVWSYTNDQNVRVVMETSVNNLTQNESTGLVHYGPNDQRVVELVRLQDPSNANEQLPAPPQGGAQQNVAKPPALTPPQAP